MTQRLASSVFQVLNDAQEVIGAGFVLSEDLAVTCAHVILEAKSGPGQQVQLRFVVSGLVQSISVLNDGWSSVEEDDIAFLQLHNLPETILPAILGSAEDRLGDGYSALGFPVFEP